MSTSSKADTEWGMSSIFVKTMAPSPALRRRDKLTSYNENPSFGFLT
jgi:hypothetical protein